LFFICEAFSALTLLVGQQEGHPACKKLEWWDSGMVICLGRGADLHMVQLMPLPLTICCSSKSRLVLPSWCQLTWVVPDRIQRSVNGCCCCSSGSSSSSSSSVKLPKNEVLLVLILSYFCH